jgi:hypothetical protein
MVLLPDPILVDEYKFRDEGARLKFPAELSSRTFCSFPRELSPGRRILRIGP